MHFCHSHENTKLILSLHYILAYIPAIFRPYVIVASGELKYKTTI